MECFLSVMDDEDDDDDTPLHPRCTAQARSSAAALRWLIMEEHTVHQTEPITTIEASAVSQVQRLHLLYKHNEETVHVATYTETSMMSPEEDSTSSPDDDPYDDTDILNSAGTDEVTAHLAAAGPVGMAAAAAVATGKKRKRPHIFESNPSIRQEAADPSAQCLLAREKVGAVLRSFFSDTENKHWKLRATLDEYTTRVGQQAIVLCISPSKPNPVFKVFGAAPLENVVRKYKNMMLEDLENALAEHAPAGGELASELPPLTIDGIPVSVDKMTQAQLRAFIPEMLKYSTGRGKPGWGKESCKPVWWPEDIPWANVRSDVRTEEQKQRVSWTQALRTIVKNCYKQHGREDLLYAFEDQQVTVASTTQHHLATAQSIAHLVPSQTVVQTINNPDGTVSLIQVGTGHTVATLADASELPGVTVAQVNYSTVTDGEVEQNWATLQGGEMTIQTTQASEATQAVASLAEAAVAASQEMQPGATVTMALNSEAAAHAVATLAEATLQGGGQIVLAETAAAVGALAGVQDATGLVQIPVSMYQTVVTSLAQGNRPVQVAMAPVTTRIDNTVTLDGQAVEVVTLEQ
ncbi:Nuclear respiratory factor 1 [Channa argus]|uniref:Nuclear respiratory factor 1 n=1 Tax=Channa argus TaxID=215402 RepID=A0A6G1QR95_CHAAH|nr:Nuclear respiratory factor 1 [Channa argus]